MSHGSADVERGHKGSKSPGLLCMRVCVVSQMHACHKCMRVCSVPHKCVLVTNACVSQMQRCVHACAQSQMHARVCVHVLGCCQWCVSCCSFSVRTAAPGHCVGSGASASSPIRHAGVEEAQAVHGGGRRGCVQQHSNDAGHSAAIDGVELRQATRDHGARVLFS